MWFSGPKTKMVLSLIILGWLGCSATVDQVAAQGIRQIPESYGDGCQVPWMDEGQYMGPDACDVPCESPCGPLWHFSAEAITLARTTTRSQMMFTSVQPSPFETSELNANELDFPVALGYQVSAIRKDLCGSDWELRYFQADGFSAETSLPGYTRLLLEPNTAQPYPYYYIVNNARAQYNSAIYSGEFNMRRQWSEALTLLAGFRMAQLNEHYLAGGTDMNSASVTHALNVNTDNHLYGFQLGADIGVYDMGGPLQINVLAKGGIFGNYAHHGYCRQTFGTGGIVTLYNEGSASRDQASFLGEAEAVATYALTKRLAFRASAKAMWLTGVALAPEQLAAVNLHTEQYSLNTSGAAFYYGGGMGLEYRY